MRDFDYEYGEYGDEEIEADVVASRRFVVRGGGSGNRRNIKTYTNKLFISHTYLY